LKTSRTLVIAEVGINHNGDPALAKAIIAAAKEAGADIAKTHTYKAEEVMTGSTPLAEYMKSGEAKASKPAASFIEMARKFELSNQSTEGLKAFAESAGIEFLSSPFDVPSVHYLGKLGLKRLKMPSGELVNPLMLEAAAATKLPLILSTGMATLEEVRYAVETLRKAESGPLCLLHCLTQYPAEFKHLNLRAMLTLAKEFPDCEIGFSDHTPGIEASVAAVALGATVIEKHLTLDKSLPGPDQTASLDPAEFARLVQAIRNIEEALGDGVKRPSEPELANIKIVRKSVVLRAAAKAGTVLSADLLAGKRPGSGIPVREIGEVIGRKLRRDLPADSLLSFDDLQ
jgi:sialic acid synthase SpsE